MHQQQQGLPERAHPLRKPHFALYPVGFLGGFLNGSISIGGPPVILFLTSQGTSKDTFRANLAAYFALTGGLATLGFALVGLLTRDVMVYAAALVPAALLGIYVGVRLSTRICGRASAPKPSAFATTWNILPNSTI